MKKGIIILFLCIITISSLAQVRLGYNFNAILREFKQQNPKSDTILFQKRIVVQNVSNTVYYYFDKKDICNSLIIAMQDEELANKYIRAYNSDFIRISSNDWQRRGKFFKNADISLSYSPKIGYFFTWTLIYGN